MSRLSRGLPHSVALLFLLILPAGCGKEASAESAARGKKVLVLGCDGMDPKLLKKLMDAGRMPNFSQLASTGTFAPLETSIPPQSPVAWSNFITGAGPGVHGIFDFIHRDPSKQVAPYFSTNRITTTQTSEPWRIGKYQIQWVKSQNDLLRRGTPFWDFLDERGISSAMYRLPANYPPSPSKHGHMKSIGDMGVPDALGSYGTFQHFTTRPRVESKELEGMKMRLRRDRKTGGYVAKIQGPANEFKPRTPVIQTSVSVYPDEKNDVAKLVYENPGLVSNETVELVLSVGEWSDWQNVIFQKTPVGPFFHTMVRFYLQRAHPDVDLYVTPLNFVPTSPEAVFSEPCDLCEEMGREIGPFYTKGFAEDYNARKQEIFTDEEYKEQAMFVLQERMKILDYALNHFDDGLLFVYFSTSDLMAHIFWWDSDEKHPCRTPEDAKKYNAVVEEVYEEIDQALGRCMKRVGEDTTVMVMSDHGFCNFTRGFGLNSWLKEKGYLVADHGLSDADWSKTQAYGLGLNGLYLNLKGREKYGSVESAQRDALLKKISEELLAVRDPKNGVQVIRRVYRTEECYKGAETVNAPDLIVGYERDYRASWNTCLGDFDKALLVDNPSPWSADHCIAHDVVPGIIVTNRKVQKPEPSLVDIAPTILSEFGISTPDTMTGRSLWDASTAQTAAR
jgi:predicted AlkP superfamily phosphohydrolase/phosphomutase